jgi:hypothetical protein
MTSYVRVDKPYSVLQGKVLKIQGRVNEAVLEQVLKALTGLFVISKK